MIVCRICGNEIRATELTIDVDGDQFHADCAGSHDEPKRRKVGRWAAMGSRGQMAMVDVQRD